MPTDTDKQPRGAGALGLIEFGRHDGESATHELQLNDSDEHSAEIRDTLAAMWQAGELCDLTLVIGSRRMRCHRLVLASASRYFRKLFAAGMRDSMLDEVAVQDVDERAFEKALAFVYRGRVAVHQSEITALLHVASRLELSALLRCCIALFTDQLSPETAIDTYSIADTLGIPQLAVNAKALILSRFCAVAAHASFQKLPPELLHELVGSDALRAKEPEVLDAVLHWVRADESARKHELATLLPLVRFPLMRVEFISDTVYAEPLVVSQPCWERLALEAYRFQTTARACPASLSRARTTIRAGTREIFAIGGQMGLRGEMSQGRVEGAVSRFCPERGTWLAAPALRAPRSKAGVAVLDGVIYCVGGSGPSGAVCATVERLEPLRGAWQPAAQLGTPRSGVGVGVVGGRLYAVGGTDGIESALASAERLSADGARWEPVAKMRTARLYAGIAVYNGLLYAIGGWEGSVDRAVATVERYDPKRDEWEYVAPMNAARSAAGIEVLGAHIYAVGGGDGASRWRSVERYCPERNAWERVEPMLVARSNLGVAALDDSLYVIGGWDGSEDFASAERFCPKRGVWESLPPLAEGRRGLRCCVAPSVY
ncbi:hypothetical protein KFE25_009587 [Diacronema lutheri]|uniref:BTB domain-containing protein n=2 Tax=Diacronema lutheri TaxID=2081491 RepID=A0A8J5XY37_DIALT|nr:hypothetical protein KFE25_009587 [Diacronema lutheri]